MTRRIESSTSRTAQWTCAARAASFCEDGCLHSNDGLSLRLLPGFVSVLFRLSPFRALYRKLAPPGGYAYTVARTKYIDEAFQRALGDGFDQALIFGAGYDTRALRFELGRTRVFELDVPTTQSAKRVRYGEHGICVPENLSFISIDFDKDSLDEKLRGSGFEPGRRTLFILEGLLMYLQAESVDATFRTMQQLAGKGSRIVFDYAFASVLRGEGLCYGERELMQAAKQVGEGWQFGIERGGTDEFLSRYDMHALDEKDGDALDAAYFRLPDGTLAARSNGAHCLVTAEKQ